MSDVFDNLIDRQGLPADAARIAAVIKGEPRFAYFGTSAFAVRLLRLDQKAPASLQIPDPFYADGYWPK